ncbi:hypothetical protein; putative signal peptide [Frankia alni ACN14a]|uniref:Uncharacterized protein n=1 Tax=Frankia alni (strain DSM 45986 / CECT 9034 / ACN14a) TaxID=326424 RepID=Q0RCZ2_FRAAA|nr:hypothetical protein; putative signal peptide [Frankia alni ACN14a]
MSPRLSRSRRRLVTCAPRVAIYGAGAHGLRVAGAARLTASGFSVDTAQRRPGASRCPSQPQHPRMIYPLPNP